MRTFEEIERNALSRNIPVMQKEGIDFLISKLHEVNALSLLEIGSAIGYSSMMMVSHVDGLKIDTIELNEERYNEACFNIKERQLEDRISIFHDDALTFDEEKLKYQPYDVLFIDAAKAQYLLRPQDRLFRHCRAAGLRRGHRIHSRQKGRLLYCLPEFRAAGTEAADRRSSVQPISDREKVPGADRKALQSVQ